MDGGSTSPRVNLIEYPWILKFIQIIQIFTDLSQIPAYVQFDIDCLLYCDSHNPSQQEFKKNVISNQ